MNDEAAHELFYLGFGRRDFLQSADLFLPGSGSNLSGVPVYAMGQCLEDNH
ncbi:MAG: hypothetical protein IPP37_20330 [Saprospiraceae bacterium]|nr:hypothetical protein [Saprospiraceae bacterium]